MRRRVVIVSILALAGVLLARRRRRRAPQAPLETGSRQPPLASPGADPAPETTRFVSVPWTLAGTAGPEPRLSIRYRADEHMELDRIDAQETPTQVFVTVLMRWRPPAGGWFAFEQEHEAMVPLGSPLGERELIHAPVDEPSGAPLYP